jgi:geranylgeranyl pyrophosphate synthase
MTKYGAVDEALGVAQSLADDAKAALTVFPNSMPRRALMALADYVVQREM